MSENTDAKNTDAKEIMEILIGFVSDAVRTGNMERVNRFAKIIKYVQNTKIAESGAATPQSKIRNVIKKILVNPGHKGNCADLVKFNSAYNREYGEYCNPADMKLSKYLETFKEFELRRGPGKSNIMYVKIKDGTKFVFSETSGGTDVGDTIESKVITTVRDMIENSNYKDYAGLSNFLATYKKIYNEQFELPANTKLSEYLKPFAELELFTHGGINTAMFVRFAKSSESE
jgi:rhamnose utilization protein RhaD (predicted bifunctional aldolase and dehydrogenase)